MRSHRGQGSLLCLCAQGTVLSLLSPGSVAANTLQPCQPQPSSPGALTVPKGPIIPTPLRMGLGMGCSHSVCPSNQAAQGCPPFTLLPCARVEEGTLPHREEGWQGHLQLLGAECPV